MSTLPTNGSVRPITRWGDPVMHRRNQPVTEFGEELQKLIADMTATMNAADGVGLAANQVGVDLQLFIFDCPDKDGVRRQGIVFPRARTAGSTRVTRVACRCPAPSPSASGRTGPG